MDEPVSDADMKAAEQCNEELTEASDELEKELERIKNMPADPNYPPENVVDELYNSVHTPNENQQDVPEDSDEEYKGDKVCSAFSTDVTLKSPEQKAAYDAAVAKYNQKTQASMNKFKDARQ